ncbi:MAG: dephospho-CoA kinase [Dehalococcoidales bacterium]|nr:dephospho-CoA kinase [Dehalococcoidales bacterium]
MKIIGLTGGIGSGKSAVARFLKDFGAEVIDLDIVGNDVIIKGKPAYQKLVQEFRQSILDNNKEIDRVKLSKIVFNDHTALEKLNDIVHPEIDKIVVEKAEDSLHRGLKVLVVEAALILEANKALQYSEIWVVVATPETALGRIIHRPNYDETEARARISSQTTNDERIKRADVVINNDGTLNELKARVKIEWNKLQNRL